MTSETIDAPAPVRAAPAPPRPGLWRRTLRRSVLVPLVVLTPLLGSAPSADDPALIRVVPLAAAVALTVAAVLFTESLVNRGLLFAQAPSRLAAVTPFAVGAGLAAAGPVVLPGGTHLLSAAVVLGVAAAACRVDREAGRLGRRRAVLLVAGGAALAAGGDIVHLALPLATVAVAARGMIVLIGRRRQMATGAPARVLALLWLGFLPAFAAARAIDVLACPGGGCDRGPDAALAVAAGGVRLWVLLLLALAVLGWLARDAARDLPQLYRADRLQLGCLAVAAAALLASGAALAVLGPATKGLVVVVVAGALLLSVPGCALLTGRRVRRRGA
jgi:hypothetical protein